MRPWPGPSGHRGPKPPSKKQVSAGGISLSRAFAGGHEAQAQLLRNRPSDVFDVRVCFETGPEGPELECQQEEIKNEKEF